MRRRLRVGMRIGLALLVGLALAGEVRPGVAHEGVCDSAPETRLAIGQWAVVADVVSTTPAGGLRLRETPRTTGVEVDLLPAGTLVRVVDGPACNDGFRWYYLSVQPLGLEGWSAEEAQNHDRPRSNGPRPGGDRGGRGGDRDRGGRPGGDRGNRGGGDRFGGRR